MYLAYDTNSSLFLPRLLSFLRFIQNDPQSFQSKPKLLAFYEPLLYAALSKSLDLWPLSQINNNSTQQQQFTYSLAPRTNTKFDLNKNFILSFIEIISDCIQPEGNSSIQKIRAFSSFLLAFAASGHAKIIIGSHKNSFLDEFRIFEEAFTKFCTRLEEIEPTISNELKNAYASVFGKELTAATIESFKKPSRVFWLVWLDSMMKFSKLYSFSFANELEYFLLTESGYVIITELITTSITMIAVSINRKDASFLTHTWYNFFIKRLPLAIRSLIVSSKMLAPSAQIELAVTQAFLSIPKDIIGCIDAFFKPEKDHIDNIFLFSNESSVRYDVQFIFLRALISLGVVRKTCLATVLNVSDEELNSIQIIDIKKTAFQTQGLIIDTSNPAVTQEISLHSMVAAAKNENISNVEFEESSILKLVVFMENLEGIYQEAVAIATFQLSAFWIEARATQSLGRLIYAFLSKQNLIDIFLLHIPLERFIGPLAQLLDRWMYDDNASNLQDEHKDFQSALLFIIFLYERYDLDLTDFGMYPPPMVLKNMTQYPMHSKNTSESYCFVVKAIMQTGLAQISYEQSSETSELVGLWIIALFEEGMISDDLMRKTSPQVLYALVPTILSQAVLACAAGVISFDTLSNGLEFFRDPFLSPILVPALCYICDNIWSDQEVQILLRVLERLFLTEVQGVEKILLSTVLSITGQELLYMVNSINCTFGAADSSNNMNRNRYFVEPRLLSLLQQYYTGILRKDYVLSQNNSVENVVKKQVSDLALWSPVESLPPIFYGEILSITANELGASRTLSIVLDQLATVKNKDVRKLLMDAITALATAPFLGKSKDYVQKYDSNVFTAIVDFQPDDILSIRRKKFKTERTDSSQNAQRRAEAALRLRKECSDRYAKTNATSSNSVNDETIPNLNQYSTDSINRSDSEFITCFNKLKQGVDLFHKRRTSMESVINQRVAQLQFQSQSQLILSGARTQANTVTEN